MKTLAAALILLAATPALAAQQAGSSRSGSSSSSLGSSAPGAGSTSLSAWLVLDPGPIGGVGVGGRVTLPLAPAGVLHSPRVKDEFTLELGADFVHYSDRVGVPGYYVDYSWNGILLVGGAAWNFWLTPRFALYPKLDLGYFFGWYSGWNDYYGYGRANFDGVFIQGAAGLIYRFQSMSLRVEFGSGLARVGLAFPF